MFFSLKTLSSLTIEVLCVILVAPGLKLIQAQLTHPRGRLEFNYHDVEVHITDDKQKP